MNHQLIFAEVPIYDKEGELKKKGVFSEVKFYAISIFENNVLFCSRILQEMHNPFDLRLKLSSKVELQMTLS